MTFWFNNVNHEGYVFTDFEARQSKCDGPGWFVFGSNIEKYGIHRASGKGYYIKLCARPDVKARAHPHYNGKVRRGWRTKREAQEVADWLNRGK